MICSKCNSEIPDAALFCPKCGTPSNTEERDDETATFVADDEASANEKDDEATAVVVQEPGARVVRYEAASGQGKGGEMPLKYLKHTIGNETEAIDDKKEKGIKPVVILVVIGLIAACILVSVIAITSGKGTTYEAVPVLEENEGE